MHTTILLTRHSKVTDFQNIVFTSRQFLAARSLCIQFLLKIHHPEAASNENFTVLVILSQKGEEITSWNQFFNVVDRRYLCVNSYKLDNIGMIILLEDFGIMLKF